MTDDNVTSGARMFREISEPPPLLPHSVWQAQQRRRERFSHGLFIACVLGAFGLGVLAGWGLQ